MLHLSGKLRRLTGQYFFATITHACEIPRARKTIRSTSAPATRLNHAVHKAIIAPLMCREEDNATNLRRGHQLGYLQG
ncbi:MAG TPA: hypothetical protein VF899_06730 [Pyrinomonadaceae bacterium]